MSTRTGVILPDELYRKYNKILFKEHKTVQADLKEYIESKVLKSNQREQ